jgi:hypothetical protein
LKSADGAVCVRSVAGKDFSVVTEDGDAIGEDWPIRDWPMEY